MAKIALNELRHSYMENPQSDKDWALKKLDVEWEDGGAYALLGPSGCGKTTLLNIISGLISPTAGGVYFDNEEVTTNSPEQRHIAQVFQFPVVYDTMTVFDNLAFPLRNRGMDENLVKQRVTEIAEMTGLAPMLQQRASGLTADGKQKISLGRGLVRTDVNVIMFDEPLTVIDPHLKWQLRSKLKELHQRINTTMIYVTHDQTEALTFADKVVVMKDGEVVQLGTPIELFEKPKHTFVGHFIGSPGMNLLPCEFSDGGIYCGKFLVKQVAKELLVEDSILELGVRPEFVKFSDEGLPVTVNKVSDAGRYQIVDTQFDDISIKLLVSDGEPIPSENAKLKFDEKFTHVYRNGWLAN